MNRTSLFKALAFAVLAIFAGAAFAYPDTASSMWQALTPHADVGAVLAFGPLVRALQSQHAAEVTAMSAFSAIVAERDLTPDEQATFDGHKAKAESLKARIATAQESELAEAGIASFAPTAGRPGSAVVIPAAAQISVSENVDTDPQRGFKSFGEYALSVRGAVFSARNGGGIDPRLMGLGGFSAAAPSSYGSESTGADGGFLVPPSYGTNIFSLSLEDQALLPMTDNMPVEGNGMSIPKDETTPWGSTGVRAYWQGEAQAGTPTKPVFGRTELKLKKLMALVPLSEELLADATALNAYLPPNMARSIRWKTDEAVLFGTGAGVPLGAFSSGAAITVAKDLGQLTGTLSATNVANMIARLMPGSYSRAFWSINNDVLPALFTLTLGNYPIYMPAGSPVGGIQGSPYGSLLGRPIVVSQHAKSFSSQGDIMLTDLSYYQSITKSAGITTATSMHLYFDADAVAFRATFRVDGQPKIAAPVSPANGSNTLSPFVQLGAR